MYMYRDIFNIEVIMHKFDIKNKDLLEDPEIGPAINKVAMAKLKEMLSESLKFSAAMDVVNDEILKKLAQTPEAMYGQLDTDYDDRQRRLVNNPFMSDRFRQETSQRYGVPLDMQNTPLQRTQIQPKGPVQINSEAVAPTSIARTPKPKAEEAAKPPKEVQKKDVEASVPKQSESSSKTVTQTSSSFIPEEARPWATALANAKSLGRGDSPTSTVVNTTKKRSLDTDGPKSIVNKSYVSNTKKDVNLDYTNDENIDYID